MATQEGSSILVAKTRLAGIVTKPVVVVLWPRLRQAYGITGCASHEYSSYLRR